MSERRHCEALFYSMFGEWPEETQERRRLRTLGAPRGPPGTVVSYRGSRGPGIPG